MEIKHTIEILTKDIQDIEKLVQNLNKYPSPPIIEIDLAKAKLRNVYELLSMISADLKKDYGDRKAAIQAEHDDMQDRRENRPEKLVNQQFASPALEHPEKRENEPVAEPGKEDVLTDNKDAASEHKSDSGKQENEEIDKIPQQEPVPEKFREEVKKASIIAEKFAANKSLNEKIAPGKTTDLSSKLTAEPIESVKRNIGINDRFLIIRELLNGDNEGYNELVKQLDACTGFDQAYGLLEKNFPDKMDHEGVELLIRLSRRRFLSKNV